MKCFYQNITILTLLIWVLSCAGGPQTVQDHDITEQSKGGSETSSGTDPGEALQRMGEFLENGMQKIDQGAISEGISQLVAVLAEKSKLSSTSPEIEEFAFQAETELAKLGAALEIEAGMEWLDDEKNQISASSLDGGTDKGLNPGVMLTLNLGGGKALVSGAPIFFEFIKGTGLLTSFVNTNDYGQATCTIARLEDNKQENIVRASLIYRIKGYSYTFKGLERDFVYLPPARKATILVMEKAGNRVAEDPVILDSVFNKLKEVAFDFSHYNGVLIGNDFMKVFGGEVQAIKKMGLEKEVSYLVMILNDGYYVKQVEMSGKKYNIFKSQTTATTRIIRVSDGTILYSGTVQGVGGQGGDNQKAVLDGFRRAADSMAEKIEEDIKEIMKALNGGD